METHPCLWRLRLKGPVLRELHVAIKKEGNLLSFRRYEFESQLVCPPTRCDDVVASRSIC